MKSNSNTLDTIYCDGCGVPIVMSNGRFLRPVMVLCSGCERRTKWHPSRKDIDKGDEKADKGDVAPQ
jgi:hypothetical protein